MSRLLFGDAAEVLATLEAGSVGVVFTSPPYNTRTKYEACEDNRSSATYVWWLRRVADALHRVLAPGGHVFLNLPAQGPPKDLMLPMRVADSWQSVFDLRNVISWVSSVAIDDVTHGHYRPINSPTYLNRCWQPVYHFTKGKPAPLDRIGNGVPYVDESNHKRWARAQAKLHCRGNVWFVPYETTQGNGKHPCVFPVGLPRMALSMFPQDTLVLDPFCGTGATLVAAQELGMSSIGIDNARGYLEAAAARLGGEIGRETIFPDA